MKGESGGKQIKSVNRAIRLLEEIMDRDRATLTELSNSMDISTTTVHHYLSTLRSNNFVERTDNHYELGIGLLVFGGIARQRDPLFEVGKQQADRLSEETGGTVRLLSVRNRDLFTIYQSIGESIDTPVSFVGQREAFHCTAAGKALLAQFSDEKIGQIIDERQLEAHTESTITVPDTLFEEIEDIRQRGFALDDEERYSGIRGVAAHVTTESGNLLGALEVLKPIEQLADDEFRKKLPNSLLKTAGILGVDSTYADWG